MTYVAILKKVGHLDKRGERFYGVDPEYPLECREYPSREEAERAHPDAQIMSAEEYHAHKAEMNERFAQTWKKRPFWKFWG